MSKKYQLHLKGYVGGYDFDAEYVDFVLSKNENNEVHVLIDSLGGAVSTALSIAASFARHGNVYVHFVGMNASAATIASLGAKHITIDENAMYLVHKVSQEVFKWASMNADALHQFIENLKQRKADLEKIDENIASMYANRCKKQPDELLELMKKGGWLNAQDALSWGFIDEIVPSENNSKPTLSKNLVNAMVDAGIPLPDIPHSEEISFLDRIRNFINNFSNNTQKEPTMSKVFTSILALLAIDALAVNDGAVSLSEEQLQTIEDALNKSKQDLGDRDSQIKNLNNQINSLNTQLDDLKNKPADKSDDVVDDRNPKNHTDVDQFINASKDAFEMFNQIP